MRGLRSTVLSLCAVAALAGLWVGLQPQQVTETQAIERAAAQFEQDTGGARTSCAAVPVVKGEIWLRVICGADAERRIYNVNRAGQILRLSRLPEA